MSRYPRSLSLGARLTLWLALQSMVSLGLVCGSLYLAMDWTLRQHQHETLKQKELALREQIPRQLNAAHPEELTQVLNAIVAGHSDLGLQIVDGSGKVIFTYLRSLIWRKKNTHVHEMEMQIAGLPTPVKVTIALGTDIDEALLHSMRWALLLAALCGSLAISAGGFVLVRRSLQPLHQLVAQARGLTAHTLERRLDGSAQPMELQPLIDQINALLDRLAAAYAQLEAFNANVAHELNTPLTTLISSSQLALNKARSLTELQDVLGSNLEELDRLARIVGDMLFLSRARRGTGARRTWIQSLASLADSVVEFYDAMAQEANLTLRVIGDAAGAVDERLLVRALSNLLNNAVRYATPGSTVELRIQRLDAGRIELAVENEGVTIAQEHLPRLFDRFFRADPARSQADRNNGLGLAIVAAIARKHNGGTFASSDAGHTRIGLWLSDPDPA